MKKIYLAVLTVLFFVSGSFAQTVVVAGADATTTTNNPYTTLGAAFASINASSQAGNVIVITVTGVTVETAPAVLNQSVGPWTSLTILPVGASQITGNIAGHLVDLNGADNVTIDGLNAAGNSLAINNSNSTASASTIRFIADASNNTITNCNLLGSSGAAVSTGLGIVFFSTGSVTGNDNNSINNCNLSAAGGGSPINAIYSLGTSAAIDNSGNTITVNNISDYFNAGAASNGMNINTGNSAWTITNNALYQTATRIYTTASTHNGIFITSGSGYTISNNVIGFGAPNGTGTTVMIGNSIPLSGTFPGAWNNTGAANSTRYIAINCAFTAAGIVSNIQNNTIGGFALYTNSGAATTNGIWCGINVTSGNVNIGTTTGNTIGSTSGQGSIYTACNTAGGTAVGIYVTSGNTVNIQNNNIGAIDAAGAVVASGCGGITGIDVAGTGVYTISNNTIGNSTANNLRAGNLATGATLSNTGTFVTTTGVGAINGIRSSSTGATLSITGNTLRGFAMSSTSSSTSSVFNGITNTGAVTGTVNIDNNFLGTAAVGLVNYAFAIGANSALTGILKSGSTTATVSISNNDFRGITNATTAANAHTYISCSNLSSTANINGNTFSNLSVNTTGAIIFIGHVGNMTATAVENVTNNSIVTAYNKAGASGSVTFFNSVGFSVNGSQQIETGNNFSNVTVTGTTTINGWSNQEGNTTTSAPTKIISNNTFTNITGGSGTIFVLYEDYGGPTTMQNNTISNINGTGVVVGFTWGTNNGQATHTISGNSVTGLSSVTTGGAIYGYQVGSSTVTTLNMYNNVATGLSTVGTASVYGILVSAGTTNNIYKNKIGDLQANNAAGIVHGILVNGGTTNNIYNNYFGDLRTPSSNAANPLNAINVAAGTTANIYYNTVYLNATSSGALFGSSAINVATGVATTLRNNIFVNNSTANGAAFTAAYRRNSTTLTSYNSASNNNLFYAGIPSATNLIFYDGTNSDQTLTAYKARVSSRDASSVTENPTFISLVATNPGFLHVNTSVPTQIESGAVNIAGITDDYDGDIRQGNGGYTGTSIVGPDIGADEGEFVVADVTAPLITSIAATTNGCNVTSRTFTANLTDVSGVDNASFKPNIYFRKNGGGYFSSAGTLTTGTIYNGTWTFTINYGTVGGVVATDLIEYFIVAQDIASPINVGGNPSAGLSLTDVNTIITPPTTPLSYTIQTPMSGTYLVGVGQVAPNYTTLTAAIADYNSRCIAGPIIFELQDALYGASETFPISINPNIDASSINTLTIQPKAAVASVISANNGTSLFDLNGAKYIRFNGLNTGGSSLLIRNTNGLAPTIRLMNDAVNNIITNSTFETSNSNFSTTTSGAIIFLTTTGTLGNSNNTISYCDFRDRTDIAGIPRVLIMSSGSASSQNANNTIDHCNFYNFYINGNGAFGIYLNTGSTDWTVSNNSFYQTATRTSTSNATSLTGVYVSNAAANNMQITGNYFGGTAALCAGGPLTLTTATAGVGNAISPIYMNITNTASVASIQNNTIQNISLTSMPATGSNSFAFGAIYAFTGSFNVSGNTIGATTGTGSITVNNNGAQTSAYAFYAEGMELSTTGGTLSVTNNNVGSITMGGTNTAAVMLFRGIPVFGTPASTVTCSGNLIGSLTTANSIQNTVTTRPGLFLPLATFTTNTTAINITNNNISNISNLSTSTSVNNYFIGLNPTGTCPVTISGNTIRELSTASGTTSAVPGVNAMTGICQSSTGTGHSISGNTITGLRSTSSAAAVSVYGIGVNATGSTGSISKNKIYDLTAPSTNTATKIYGTSNYVGSTWTYSNNMISLINGANTNAVDMQGMHEETGTGTTANYYYNSVYLGGSAGGSAINTYAFNRTLPTTVNIKDNIFSNMRTGGSGYHVALANTNAAATGWSSTASDFNDLYNNAAPANLTQWLGSGAVNNLSLAGWQTATGGDANAVNVFPVFTNTATGDLHLNVASNCRLDGYGTPIAGFTTDYDAQTRDAGAPDMGADEFTTAPVPSSMATASNCDTKNVSPLGTLYLDGSCNLIAKVLPSGGNAVAGKIKTCVTIDGTQQYFNGQPYVQRHYDIEPTITDQTTTSATVTLYFTDAEFTAYNTNNPAWPPLPTLAGGGNSDPNRANVKVTQFHGVGSTNPTSPGNYPGVRVLILPTLGNVFWNGSYWEITFDVAGFSGFYIHTNNFNSPLPIIVNYLTGRRQGSNHLLNWKVTCASTPRATMTLERSSDGRTYTGINTITADAARCNSPFDYTDANPLKGMNYYRLKIVDADGHVTYSTTVALLNAIKGFDIISIAPNPVVNNSFKLNVTSAQSAKMEIGIFDMQGRLVNRQTLSLIAGYNSIPVDVANLAAGTYTIKGNIDDDQSKVIRFVKQ